jgi:aryl sulfotransferase
MQHLPARCVYRTWMTDSRRWAAYRPRVGDVIIATYPKCGTTWMQQIVGLLIFQSPKPKPVQEIGAWVDRRLDPVSEIMHKFEAQTHRRFLKSHLPFDGMPIYDDVRYIHVGRDGRDACLSYHNQITRFRTETLQALDGVGLSDELIGRPYPRVPTDPRAYFRMWMCEGVSGATDGSPHLSYFDFERTYWEARRKPNLLMVHYRDLKSNLDEEMRRIACFLDITISEAIWPSLVKAATFQEMRREGAKLAPRAMALLSGGAADFFQKGENDRWRGTLTNEDLELYEQMVSARLSQPCARWLRHGSREFMEPREADD